MGFLSTFVQGLEAILTSKGDILSFSTVRARLAVGSNDQVLTADSGEATGLKWASAGGNDRCILGNGVSNLHLTSAVRFGAPFGDLFTTTEVNAQINLALAGTMKTLRIFIDVNPASNTNTIVSRISGSDGNLTVSYTAGQTGSFADVSNTDVIAVTDEVTFRVTQASSGNIEGRYSLEYVFS